jgi:hypothetical protein
MYILRTKNRTTPRKAMTRMVTMAAIPPPEMPLDEPDAASALDAALVAEGVGVGAKVLLLLVVGEVVGNEMAGVGVAVVEITDDDVNDNVSSVVVGKSVESVASVGKSVAVAGSTVASVSVVVKGSKAGSVDRSPRPSSVAVKAGSLGSIVKVGKLSPLRRRFPK